MMWCRLLKKNCPQPLSSLFLSVGYVLPVFSSSMASAIPNAVLVDPPKTESVKSLAESTCLSSLPSIYTITHNLHAEAVSNDPEDSVPIVDISLLASGSPDEQSQVIQQIGKACLDWGCFMVIHCVIYLLILSFLFNLMSLLYIYIYIGD
jgi:hypothetical protein